jgi:hypothetical protein
VGEGGIMIQLTCSYDLSVRLGVDYEVTAVRMKPFTLVRSSKGLGAWFIHPIILREKAKARRVQRDRGL